MKIFAISDLHLSFDPRIDKPMDIYGSRWENHAERLKSNWLEMISPEDIVMMPGDMSWGLKIDEARADLDWISSLPGQKVLVKGNHDLWWSAVGRLNKLYDNLYFLQNTCYPAGDVAICGTRGWVFPGAEDYESHDLKIYKRELLRLEFSLKDAEEKGFKRKLAMLHYPPTDERLTKSGFTDLFEKYQVEKVVYGHLHGRDNFGRSLNGVMNATDYSLVSVDYLGCKPKLILDFE